MKSILLITHDTSLSGAPKSVLLVFEELKKIGYKFTTIALKGGGKLEPRFIKLSDQYFRLDTISKQTNYSFVNRLKRKVIGKTILSTYDLFLKDLTSKHFDYIYANTVLSLSFAILLKQQFKCLILLHVHELNTVIDEFQPELGKYDHEVDNYIVPSELNRKCLEEEYGIPSSKIHVVRESTDFNPNMGEVKSVETTKTRVLMCGGAYWRKGDDLFIQVASLVLSQDSDFEFYWIGSQSIERQRVNRSDILKLGIVGSVFFIDETETPEQWYLNADIFILTSREDPFPLAAIEAGILGLPIICFEKATGISEVIDATCIVPYLDVESMSKKVLELKHSSFEMKEISANNMRVFQEFKPGKIASQINLLLSTYVC